MRKMMLFSLFLSIIVSMSCFSFPSEKTRATYLNNELNKANYSKLSSYSKKQVNCLADNIYREAVGESTEGKYAVGFVTMNRVNSGKFAETICGVVYQKTGNIFQFSWVGSKKRLNKIDQTIYNDILKIATIIYSNSDKLKDNTNGALFYHATYVKPNWKNLERTNQIGQHIFYKQQEI